MVMYFQINNLFKTIYILSYIKTVYTIIRLIYCFITLKYKIIAHRNNYHIIYIFAHNFILNVNGRVPYKLKYYGNKN